MNVWVCIYVCVCVPAIQQLSASGSADRIKESRCLSVSSVCERARERGEGVSQAVRSIVD